MACHPSVAIEETAAAPAEPERRYRVTKMKFGKTKGPTSGKNVNDKTTDKDSSITNDANLWVTETMQNPKYPLELLLRVVTVSLETVNVVNGLPSLDIK